MALTNRVRKVIRDNAEKIRFIISAVLMGVIICLACLMVWADWVRKVMRDNPEDTRLVVYAALGAGIIELISRCFLGFLRANMPWLALAIGTTDLFIFLVGIGEGMKVIRKAKNPILQITVAILLFNFMTYRLCFTIIPRDDRLILSAIPMLILDVLFIGFCLFLLASGSRK